ncbi:class I SAM-dependent methyltransferase [Rhizobacter sp. LjRoot28]|uniref:class I SAM-dependent methyltransferase n=1 Tax=Rhizobacter sp. LjRoot28 TaxID=3342309 RepID=UPI003ECDA548
MTEAANTPPETTTPRRPLDLRRVLTVLNRLVRADGPPWLHGEVARRMAERLGIIRLKPEVVVDWWGFAGAGGQALADTYPRARRIVVEPTEGLRERSRKAARAGRWPWQRGTGVEVVSADDLSPNGAQLIWANMMLHGVWDPTAVLDRWHRALAVDGFVMFSCLGPDTLRELRDLYARLGWPPAMAEFIDMHDLGDMLVHAGFADPVMDQETLRLSWPDAEALLAELRGLGGNASPSRFAGLRTPRWRQRLVDELNALRGPDGRLHMRFEVAYGHAFKAPPRPARSSETTVSLEQMRTLVRKRDT